MTIKDAIYNLVLYDYRVKRCANFLLRSNLLVRNPIYAALYNKTMTQRMHTLRKIPFRVMLENTNLCDSDCSFCPHKNMQRATGIMDLDLSKKIIDDCQRLSIEYITVYGFGEPLLDKYFFQRIEYAKAKGIKRVTTNTNACYMDKEKAKLLVDSRIDEIYISFDAFTAETYRKIRPNLDFAKVGENILYLTEAKKRAGRGRPLIVLSFVESRVNKGEVKSYLEFWKNKVDYISISSAHNWAGDINPEAAHMPDSYFRDPCRLLWTDMFILHNGDVALCCNDYEGRVILGNVSDFALEKIWSGESLAQAREKHSAHKFSEINICKNCNYNYHYKSNWWVSK